MLVGRRLAGTLAIERPSMRISPPVGCSKPASMRRSVVLPQPEGPRREKNSPRLIAKETPSTAATVPKCLDTCLISITSPPFCAISDISRGTGRHAAPPQQLGQYDKDGREQEDAGAEGQHARELVGKAQLAE